MSDPEENNKFVFPRVLMCPTTSSRETPGLERKKKLTGFPWNLKLSVLFRGGSRIFFRRGCTRPLLYFNTNKPHSFFLQNTSCIRKPQVISGRGGAHPLHPPPRSAPVVIFLDFPFNVLSSTATKEYALAERLKTVDSVLIRTQFLFSKPLNE